MDKRFEVRESAPGTSWPWQVYDNDSGNYGRTAWPTKEQAQADADILNEEQSGDSVTK